LFVCPLKTAQQRKNKGVGSREDSSTVKHKTK